MARGGPGRLGWRRGVALGAGLAAGVGCGLGLAAGGLPPPAASAAGVVLLMAIFWIAEPIPLWATALLPVPLFPALGIAPLGETVVQYLDPVNFLFLGGMWLAAAMEQWGLHRRLALAIVAAIGTSPRRVVLGFMIATAFLSLWISNTAAALMMAPIGVSVARRLETAPGAADPRGGGLGAALMLGIAYAASIGGIGTKIGTGTNLVFVKEAGRALGREVDFLTWLTVGLPIVAVAIPAAWVYLVRLAAPVPAAPRGGEGAGRTALAEERARLGPVGRGERVAAAAFLMAALLWTFRQDLDLGAVVLPGWQGLVPWGWDELLGRPAAGLPPPLSGLLSARGAEGAIALGIGLLLLVLPVERRPLRMALDARRAAGISWGLLGLLGGGFAMAHGITASGLSRALGEGVRRLAVAGTPAPFVALVLVCLVTVALSEVASNTATASILLPLLAATAPAFGLAPETLMFAATCAASFGFMLPAGTPPNAVAYASGFLTVSRMARCGLAVDVAGALLVATVCHLLVPWAFGLR